MSVIAEQAPWYIQTLIGGGIFVWMLEKGYSIWMSHKKDIKERDLALERLTMMSVVDCSNLREVCSQRRDMQRDAALEDIHLQLKEIAKFMEWQSAGLRLLAKKQMITATDICDEIAMAAPPRSGK
jgi:hypothetical protein